MIEYKNIPLGLDRKVERTVLSGHKSSVYSVAFSPDGTRIVSGGAGSSDNLKVWDAETGEIKHTLSGHTNTVWSVAFSPDGTKIVSGSNDQTVRIWNVETGSHIRTLSGHTHQVYSVAFSPDGTKIVSGDLSTSNNIRIWNAETGAHIRTLSGHTNQVLSVAFSPDGTKIVSGSIDQSIRIWNAETGSHIRTLSGHTNQVWSVAFSPDGTKIASGSSDRSVRIWNAETGSHIRTLSGHTSQVLSVAFSPDGTKIVSGSIDQSIRTWDAETGSHIRTLSGHTNSVLSAAFSPDGTKIVSGSSDQTVRIWNAETGSHIRTLSGHTGAVYSVAFSPDGTKIVSGSQDQTVRIWDAETGSLIRTLSGHTSQVYSVAFSPDGTKIVSGDISGLNNIRIWDAETGTNIRTMTHTSRAVYSVAFSPDGTKIVSGSGGASDNIRIWNAETGALIRTLSGHTSVVYSVAFSPDGTRIVSGSHDRSVRIWNAETGAPIRTLSGHTGAVYSAAFSPDGTKIVSGDLSSSNNIRTWDAETGSHIRTLSGHTNSVWSVAFSPDGTRIVSGSVDQSVRIWDVETGVHIRTLSGHTSQVWSVAFSPDDTKIASGSDGSSNNLRIWEQEKQDQKVISRLGSKIDLKSRKEKGKMLIYSGTNMRIINNYGKMAKSKAVGVPLELSSFASSGDIAIGRISPLSLALVDLDKDKIVKVITGHKGVINQVTVSPNGSVSASSSEDRTIKTWDTETGDSLNTLDLSSVVRSLWFASDDLLLCGDVSGRVFGLDPTSMEEIFSVATGLGEISSMGASKDCSTMVVSGKGRGSARVYQIPEGNLVEEISLASGAPSCVDISLDGKIIAIGERDRTVSIWRENGKIQAAKTPAYDSTIGSLAFAPNPGMLMVAEEGGDLSILSYGLINFDVDIYNYKYLFHRNDSTLKDVRLKIEIRDRQNTLLAESQNEKVIIDEENEITNFRIERSKVNTPGTYYMHLIAETYHEGGLFSTIYYEPKEIKIEYDHLKFNNFYFDKTYFDRTKDEYLEAFIDLGKISSSSPNGSATVRLSINGKEIEATEILIPGTIRMPVPVKDLEEENSVHLKVQEFIREANLYEEGREFYGFTRDLVHDNHAERTVEGNVALRESTGFGGQGSFYLSAPTEGKAKIEKIEITAEEDRIFTTRESLEAVKDEEGIQNVTIRPEDFNRRITRIENIGK